MSNPSRKRQAKRRSNPSHHASQSGHHSHSGHRKPRRRIFVSRRRSNPGRAHSQASGAGRLTDPKFLMAIGGGALAGGFGSRYLTSLVLGDKNEGAMGYIGNLIASALIGAFGGRFLGREFFGGAIAGGVVATSLRIYEENNPATPTGQAKSLQGYGGDLSFPHMGIYVPGNFAYPQTYQWQNGNIVSAPSVAAAALPAAQAVPALPAAGTQAEPARYSRY